MTTGGGELAYLVEKDNSKIDGVALQKFFAL